MWSFGNLGFEPVRFYDTERRFGILHDAHGHGPKVFFHLNDGRMSVVNPLKDEVCFGTDSVNRVPRVGECLIFKPGRNAHGPKATQWVYHDQWAKIRDALPDIRLRKQRQGNPWEKETSPEWLRGRFQGDVECLHHSENHHWWANVCVLNASIASGADLHLPLPPHSGEDEHGLFTMIWERGVDAHHRGDYHSYARGGWEVCEDPRHLSLR